MDSIDEIQSFLRVDARLDLKAVALGCVLGLTGTEDGRCMLLRRPCLLSALIFLAQDKSESIAKEACLAIVNISAEELGSRSLLFSHDSKGTAQDADSDNNIVVVMIKMIMDPDSCLADHACMILSNLTRPSGNIEHVILLIEKCGFTLDQVVSVFTTQGYNRRGANLHYLGPMFSNLSQSITFRRFLMDHERCIIQRLLPFTEYESSHVRRGGIVGTLRNCCFDIENHDWLLSPKVDILPCLLLPLAGPEEFEDTEMDKLPPELQYLPESKLRETDPDIRKMLLEALIQLCAKRSSRELMRERNTYLILREFHKWEKDRTVLLACENVVDILIRTEDEIGEDNIHDIDVPLELHQKFQKMDEDFIKD
ncbi:protein HGH1 homolog isoform X2 [Zootermopsis nevadensis]|uniref:Protein HGH1 homolog n=1 Tax=Zootermopsis nevadensis TaxID=136037 RepID=A0A067RB34_ZOONE|nr:protein HGH1 homolog isoform X2 [Zootermopsis nevadensis]KDR19997.1 Brain protein 16 [Zootermopsis nevadensis]